MFQTRYNLRMNCPSAHSIISTAPQNPSRTAYSELGRPRHLCHQSLCQATNIPKGFGNKVRQELWTSYASPFCKDVIASMNYGVDPTRLCRSIRIRRVPFPSLTIWSWTGSSKLDRLFCFTSVLPPQYLIGLAIPNTRNAVQSSL